MARPAPAGHRDLRILFVTTEFADFTKTGGLGAVSAELPRALRREGVDVRLLLPGVPALLAALAARGVPILSLAELPRRLEDVYLSIVDEGVGSWELGVGDGDSTSSIKRELGDEISNPRLPTPNPYAEEVQR